MKVEQDVTEAAKQIWEVVMPGFEWPKGWVVVFKNVKSVYGTCWYFKRQITLSSFWAKTDHNIIETLIHEMIHMHFGRSLRHGRKFRAIQGAWLKKLYGYDMPVTWKGKLYDPKTGGPLVKGYVIMASLEDTNETTNVLG